MTSHHQMTPQSNVKPQLSQEILRCWQRKYGAKEKCSRFEAWCQHVTSVLDETLDTTVAIGKFSLLVSNIVDLLESMYIQSFSANTSSDQYPVGSVEIYFNIVSCIRKYYDSVVSANINDSDVESTTIRRKVVEFNDSNDPSLLLPVFGEVLTCPYCGERKYITLKNAQFARPDEPATEFVICTNHKPEKRFRPTE